MSRILIVTDGSAGARRAVDYAAQRAKREGADLMILNVIGGYGLPDKAVCAFTRAQGAWLHEELASLSAQMLTEARDRARKFGVRAIRLESRKGEVAHHHQVREGNRRRSHRRRQARRRTGRRNVARQRVAKAGEPRHGPGDRRSVIGRRRHRSRSARDRRAETLREQSAAF